MARREWKNSNGVYIYPKGRRWRLVIREQGERRSLIYATHGEAEADAWRVLRQKELGAELTVSECIDRYLTDLRSTGVSKAHVTTTGYRLRGLLADVLDDQLGSVTQIKARRAYEAYRVRPTARGTHPSVDTHRNALSQARSCWRRLGELGIVRGNPWATVRGVGRRTAGKVQPTIDETRRLVEVGYREADGGDVSAVAVLCVVLFGLRASEVTTRHAQDLDDRGRILRVPRGKTANAVRSVEVPDELRDHLRRLAAGGGQLFSGRDRHWLGYHCRRLCGLAKIREYGPHAFRGALSSRLVEAGLTAAQVAAALGHGSSQVTERHYIDDDAAARTEQRKRLRVLSGGRS